MTSDSSVLTIRETAGRLKVCRTTVYRIINSGKLRTFYVESAQRIRVSDLNDYIERQVVANARPLPFVPPLTPPRRRGGRGRSPI
jgi:excisionase family DNA binding protein